MDGSRAFDCFPMADNCTQLRDGSYMPRVSFGVYQSMDAYASVTTALSCGYRSIDTARVYKNEKAVGKAILDAMSVQGLLCGNADSR